MIGSERSQPFITSKRLSEMYVENVLRSSIRTM